MPPSDAQKKARDKWDKANTKVVACKLRTEEAEAFKQYAANQGKTANTLIKEYVLRCISE